MKLKIKINKKNPKQSKINKKNEDYN